MGYSNFKDPFGLLKRMLLSGNKTAYFVLLREILQKFAIPFDFLLQGLEKKLIGKFKNDTGKPILLILGGSRSGTTLLYQTLAQYLPVSYVNNFNALFYRSPIAAYKLFDRLIPRTKTNFQSYFGSVKGFGGPNDAFHIWNRWLGENRNRVDKKIGPQEQREMQNFFNAWMQVSKKPFLCKNNRNTLCARMLDQNLENVFFVEIYRHPIYVAQSLVLSRRSVQGSDKVGWGVLGEDLKENGDELAYIDNICLQVYRVNKAIEKERTGIDPQRYIRVAYEDFCENPANLIQIVGIKALNHSIDYTKISHLKFSTASNSQRLTDQEFNRIRLCFDKLYREDEERDTTKINS